MLSQQAIALAVVAVGASIYVNYYGLPNVQQEPAYVQHEVLRAANMKTSEPIVLILGRLLFIIAAGAFVFEMGQAFVSAVKRYRWRPVELPPLQPLTDEQRQAAATAATSSQARQQQLGRQQQQQQSRQQQPSPTDHDERRRRALEALQREHDEKAAALREQQKQEEATRVARKAAAAAEQAAKAAAATAAQQAAAAAQSSHWERWEAAMLQQYGGNTSNNPNPGGSVAAPSTQPQQLPSPQQAELDAARLVRQQQDEEYQASLAADAQKRREREVTALLKSLKAALARALPPEAAAAEADADAAAGGHGSTTLAIRVRLPDGSTAVRQFAGVQSFTDVLDWVYSLPGMPLLWPGAWGLASSFPKRQLAAAEGMWVPSESTVNSAVNFPAPACLEECIEAGSSLGRARRVGEEAGYEAVPGALSLSIRPLVGQVFSVQVLQHSSVLDVKHQVERHTGLLPEDQRLIFAGQVLEDEQALQVYKIGSQHTLQLAPRASGASSRAGSSSGGGSGAPVATAASEAQAAAEIAGDGMLVVSTVGQLREEVAHGASQLALYVVET